MRIGILLILAIFCFTNSGLSQGNEKSYFLIGTNHTYIKNNEYFQSSNGLGGGSSAKYSEIKNRPGLLIGVQSNKFLWKGTHLHLGSNVMLERFLVDSIESSLVLSGRTISSSVAMSTRSTVNIDLRFTLSFNLIKNKIDIYSGYSLLIAIKSFGAVSKTTETYFDTESSTTAIEYTELDPVLSETSTEESMNLSQSGALFGISYKFSPQIKFNLNYVHGLSNSRYPFRINRFELFVSKLI